MAEARDIKARHWGSNPLTGGMTKAPAQSSTPRKESATIDSTLFAHNQRPQSASTSSLYSPRTDHKFLREKNDRHNVARTSF